MASSIIKVENLTKSFGSVKPLDNINFEVSEGENLVVFGRSGAGKSVLLKCIIGLLKPDSGNIWVFGKNIPELNIDELNEIRKNMGFLFQGAALYDSMTVKENLEFPLTKLLKLNQEEINKRIIEALEMVGLKEALNKMPSELSGGMKKRIGLARSIITRPKIILYDEPTTGLDPITTKEISKLIVSLQKFFNMTSITVTHDILCAKIIADRAIMLREGKIIFNGTIEEIEKTENEFLKNFFSYEEIKN
jgi:phospholipid/cholesterol/gamma-HCH transport system ATP-binding protein